MLSNCVLLDSASDESELLVVVGSELCVVIVVLESVETRS